MEPTRHPFPVSSTARTIGEQKAKVNTFHGYFTEVHSGSMLLLPVGASGYGAHDALGFSRLRSLIAFFLKQSSGIYLDDYRSFVDLAYPFFLFGNRGRLDLLPCSALLVFPMWRAGRFPAAVAEAGTAGELCSMT